MSQLELFSVAPLQSQSLWPTALTARPFASYLAALGLLRLLPSLKGQWQGDRFYIDCEPETAIAQLVECYQPSPLLTPWNKAGGWLVKEAKANAQHVTTWRGSADERFRKLREAIAAIDAVYDECEAAGFFKKGDYAQPDCKQKFVARLRMVAPSELVEWIDVVYAFLPEFMKAIPLAGKAGSEGTGEYSKTFADAIFTLFDADGQPRPGCDRALRAVLLGDTAPVQSKISPGLYDPSAGGLGRRFTDGSKFDPTINPWEIALCLEGVLFFASQTANKLDGFDRGDAVVPFAVRGSQVGYSSAAEEGFKLELWVPLWSKLLAAKQLAALFRRGRSRLNDKAVRDGVQFARSLPQLGERTQIPRFERYGIIERASERGNTWACHLGSFMVKEMSDVALVSQAEGWVYKFSEAAGSRTLKESYFKTLTGQQRLEDFVVDLGDSLARADRSPGKFKELRRPQLGAAWVQRLLDENCQSVELRLAIALSTGWTFKRDRQQEEREYLRWTSSDLVEALIDANREWARRASQSQAPTHREPPHARPDDLAQFLREETDDRRLWQLARGLRVASTADIDLGFDWGVFPPGFEAIAICWHWCRLWRRSDRIAAGEQTFVYEGQILTGLAAGQAETAKTAIATALRRLRTDLPKGQKPTLKDGYSLPPQVARRWAAALAFPLNDLSAQKLLDSITYPSKTDDD